ALFDVAVGASENVRRFECRCGRGQGDGDFTVAGADGRDPNVGNEGTALLCSGSNLERSLVVAPASHGDATCQQQQHASTEQSASIATSPLGQSIRPRNDTI